MDKTSDLSLYGASLMDLADLLKISFEDSTIAKSITNADGKTIYNGAFYSLTGYSKAEISILNPNKIIHPDDVALSNSKISNLLTGNDNTVSFEKRYLGKNNGIIWAKDHVYLHRDKNGNPKFYLTEITDLSDCKEAEANFVDAFLEITKRKKVEKALQESEDKYRMIVETQTDLVVKVDVKGNFLYVSPSYCQVFNKTEAELLGNSFIPLVHEDDVELTQTEMKKLFAPPYSCQLEQRAFTKDGWRWFSWSDTAELNTEKEVIAIIGVGRDITERKLADEALRESENRFRNLLQDVSSIAVQGYLPDGTTIYWNKASENLYGYTMQEAIGKNLLDLIIPNDMKEFVSGAVKYMAETGIPIPASELALKRKDGLLVDVFSSHTIIKLPGRKQELYCLDIDISERIKADKKLKENQRFIELITEQSPDIIYVYDVALNRNIYINKNLREMLNYPLGSVPEDAFELFDLIMHPDDFKNFIDYDELVKNWDTEYIHSYEYRLKDASGQWRWFLGREKEFERDNKKIKRLIGLVTEITDRKKTELELIKAKEKAEESDRLKTAFLQNMSHEIRTPMNAIMGFSQLIKSQYNNQVKLEKYADIITQRSNDLLDIINDILDIAKIESGQLPINIEECNLNALFLELTAFFEEYKKRIKKDHIQFKLQALCLPSNANIATDKVKLKQILINLISNAFKFTEKGSIEGGCKLDTHGNVLFYVKDTGIGISAEKHNDIFERFTQLNSTKSQSISGTGLGLSIVKGLVELLGGKIWLKSVPGKGSTFSFTLPFKTYTAELHTSDTVNEPANRYFAGQTVLIVEDDESNAEYLKEILEHSGMKIYHAQSGEEAIKLANTANPDFILMDVRLPKMNGYEAAQQIKLQHPTIKIIAQTAYASPEERKKAADAGCIGYLSKPLHKDELLALLGK